MRIQKAAAHRHQLGLECDPALAIFRVTKNDKGEEQLNEVAQVDDADTRGQQRRGGDGNNTPEFDAAHDDPATKFTLPEDGTYRLVFHPPSAFFRRVELEIAVDDPERHYHVPLLVSPYSCASYRGS